MTRRKPSQGAERTLVKLHLKIDVKEFPVDEVVEGANAEAVVAAMQKRVAGEMGFLAGAFVRSMTPLAFAQEATRRYNTAMKDNAPTPQSCDEFVRYGVEKGFATVLDDGGAAPATEPAAGR